jgi:hypothetical protein
MAGDGYKRIHWIHRFRQDGSRHRHNVAAFGFLLKLREGRGLKLRS